MLAIFENRERDLIRHHMQRLGDHPAHFHKYVEVLLPTDCDITVYISGQKYILHKGELYILFPYIVHYNDPAPTKTYLLQFYPEVLPVFRDIFVSKRPASPFVRVKNVTPSMIFLIKKIMETPFGNFGDEIILGSLTALVGEILQNIQLCDSDFITNDSVQNILLFCTKNCMRSISVDDVAKGTHVSKSYVSHVFSKVLHYNFRMFINDLRVDAAKKLLIETEKPVTDILLECGFQNQSTFNNSFLRRCKITPLKYRKHHKKS